MIRRSPSQILKQGYSEEEIELIYSLGRNYLDLHFYNQAEKIFNGLVKINPDFFDAWTALSIVSFLKGNIDQAYNHAKQASRINSNSIEIQLLFVTILLSQRDYSTAGTYLGEIQELIDSGRIHNQDQIRYFKAQMLRFEYKN